MLKLTDEQFDAWIEALESGRYQQGKCYLRSDDDHFCCLGVLCDILNPDGWTGSVREHSRVWTHEDATESNTGAPRVLGVDSTALAEMNDGGVPFPKIADTIRNRHLRWGPCEGYGFLPVEP